MGRWAQAKMRGRTDYTPPPTIPAPPDDWGLTANSVIPGLTYTVDAEEDNFGPAGTDGYMAGFSDASGGPYAWSGSAPFGDPITSLQFGWGDTAYVVIRYTFGGVPVSPQSLEKSITHP